MLYYQVLADLLNNTLFKILWKNEAYIVHNETMQCIHVRYKICRRTTVSDICYIFDVM